MFLLNWIPELQSIEIEADNPMARTGDDVSAVGHVTAVGHVAAVGRAGAEPALRAEIAEPVGDTDRALARDDAELEESDSDDQSIARV